MTSRARIVAAAAIVFAVFAIIQYGGGAYAAEFDGSHDEPSHFMTALMLRDYVLTWPFPNPIPWAEQYYLHYPRVALGQWPPAYHMLLGAWWILLPPCRETALLLQGLLAALSAFAFFLLADRENGTAIASFCTAAFLATPLFQYGASQVMSEPLNLLLVILLLDAIQEFVASGGQRRRARIAVLVGLSLLVKGTGLALIPAPALALVISGQWRKLRALAWPALGAVIVLLACTAWYLSANPSLRTVLNWAGVDADVGWNWKILTVLAGWGCLLAALGRIAYPKRLGPLDAASLSVVISVVAVSYVVRAMDSDRHWIAALPALLLLGASFLTCLGEVHWMGRAAAAGVMLALFRWEHYRQHGNQMIEVLRQIQLPARILVSSAHPAREGPWVAAVAAADRRPSSLVARATHSIAWENFAGTNYRLKTRNEEELEAFLDRHAINVLIVDDTGEYSSVREHHTLLKRLLQSSPNWAARAHGGKIAMFRRVQPPKQPRQPFEIELRNRRRTIVEQY